MKNLSKKVNCLEYLKNAKEQDAELKNDRRRRKK